MKYRKLLYSVNGLATMELAKIFLTINVGDKIPTVTEFNEKIGAARGTIQNSIKLLQKEKAIVLESRGHLGTFLIEKSTQILLEFSGITSIVGVMPLPYSKRYEGLATGLIMEMTNAYNLPVSLAYMRGAHNRVNMLLSDRYDYAIVSKYAALEMKKRNINIEIIKSFGDYSYLSHHVIVFHDLDKREIEDGMKIGIDEDSVDQSELTMRLCQGKNVEFIPIEYSKVLEKTMNGEIDAAVWNEDEITDKLVKINYQQINMAQTTDTEAVLVVDASKKELSKLLLDMIDVDEVLYYQKLVLEGRLMPRY